MKKILLLDCSKALERAYIFALDIITFHNAC